MRDERLAFLDSTKRVPLMALPVRTVVVTLGTGKVLLSPGSELSLQQLQGAGDVTDVVVPSLFHLGGAPRALEAFPRARLWGPRGARQARPRLPWGGIL